jgi:chromosome segregation ATPase
MGRPGVIYQDVAMAAEQLAAQGRNPTIESVRALLGTGSTATVGPYLRAWRNKQDASRQLALKEKLPEELIAVLKGLWDRVFIEAEASFETERLETRQSLIECQQKLAAMQTDYNRAQQKTAVITEEKLVIINEKLSLEQTVAEQAQRITEITSEKNAMAIQLAAQTTRIEELHQLHVQVQRNLEHYREASLEQRRLDQQTHDQQRQQLEQTIQQLRHESIQLQHQLAIAQQQLVSEQKETDRYVDNIKKIEEKMETSDKILVETKEELLRQTHASAHWNQQYQALNVRAEENAKAVIETKTQLAVAIQKLTITEESLREVTAQNRMLVKDKWILEQERAAS